MKLPKPWLEPLARAGYASRGVVFLIIGFFAVLSVFDGSDTKDSKGALLTLLQQPFGHALMILMIAGLFGYVTWRLVQVVFDTDDHGFSPKGLSVRIGLLISAGTYTVLAYYALALIGVPGLSSGSDAGPNPVAAAIAGVIGVKPLLGALSLLFAGVAIAHWYKAVTQRYADHFRASDALMRWIHPISMIGLIARGTVLGVIGLLLAFRFFDPNAGDIDSPGLEAALGYIRGLPLGRWLLLATGVGLMLFASYSLLEAGWRRINVEDAQKPI